MHKILLVEDNYLNRDMLSRRLGRRGYHVVTAADGRQCIAEAHAELPDLILMDLSLPGVDGWEALLHLKSDPKTRHIPVIALTAHAMMSDRQKAFEAGFDDYDCKPIELDRLLGKMRLLLSIQAA